jgi:hypothetical protein
MSEGSGGPWKSSGAHVSASSHDLARAEPGDAVHAGDERVPSFPTERAERIVEGFSRFAGPAIFFLVLALIGYFLIK